MAVVLQFLTLGLSKAEDIHSYQLGDQRTKVFTFGIIWILMKRFLTINSFFFQMLQLQSFSTNSTSTESKGSLYVPI